MLGIVHPRSKTELENLDVDCAAARREAHAFKTII